MIFIGKYSVPMKYSILQSRLRSKAKRDGIEPHNYPQIIYLNSYINKILFHQSFLTNIGCHGKAISDL